jgi:putative protease
VLGGKGENSSCSEQCRHASYALLDRKGVVFPVEMDQRCLMHIYNSRELCLLDTLPYLVQAGPAVLRIEARLENETYVARAVKAYRQVLESLHNYPDRLLDLSAQMEKLVDGGPGFTRGHYYRGVMD